MRAISFFLFGILCLGIVGCKADKTKSNGPKGATLEEKLESFLDKQIETQNQWKSFLDRHKLDPKFVRNSEGWNIKITTYATYDKVHPTREHQVTIAGSVVTAGSETPEIIKLIVIRVDSRYSSEYKDWKSGVKFITIPEADLFLNAIDSAIKVQSQASLGGSDFVRFNHGVIKGLTISGGLSKPSNWDTKPPEFKLNIEAEEAEVELKPGEWMELKLKIEAAKKWLEIQNGDSNLIKTESSKK